VATKPDVSWRGVLFWPLEWLFLAVATVNLVWVIFDLSYVQLRDFYVLRVPELVRLYDPMKGIEPHRITERYLRTVDAYKAAADAGDATREAALLPVLRILSAQIVDDSPFELAGKQGTLERIKNRIRRHVGDSSSKQSFLRFWSGQNMTPTRRVQQLEFFDKQLRPLFAVNYYRNYGEDGEFVDGYFRRVDVWFMGIFALELMLRTFVTYRSHPRWTWQRCFSENSFDGLNLLPAVNLIPGVHLGWLALARVFTYGDRLERLGIFPSPIAGIIHRYSMAIADEVTDLVVVKALAQVQDAVRTADLTAMLPRAAQAAPRASNDPPTAIDGFVKEQTAMVVKEVLPQVRPELEQLLAHSIKQSLPLPNRLTSGLVNATLNAAYGAANGVLKADPEGERLTRQLLDKLLRTLSAEWREHGTVQDAQQLIVTLLEQARRDYIRRNGMDA
jgi:hypothetical protein